MKYILIIIQIIMSWPIILLFAIPELLYKWTGKEESDRPWFAGS